MEDYPRNLTEFEARFSGEEACRNYLFRLRWPEGFRCPRCGGGKAWPVRRVLFECAHCGAQVSVTAGTIFQDTRLPLTLWFRAMWWVTAQKNGASALGLQRILGLGSYKTAWGWLHKLRRAMVRPGRERLQGWVEVDETYVGGLEEGVSGRQTQTKALVAVACEQDGPGMGRVRLRRIADASAASLGNKSLDSHVKLAGMETKGSFWPAVQGTASVYCAVLGTVSFLYPAQPGQPLWQGVVRVSAPPAFALALAMMGLAFGIPAIWSLIRSLGRGATTDGVTGPPPATSQPQVVEPAQSAIKTKIFWATKSTFDSLSWSQKVALNLIYQRPGVTTSELRTQLQTMDFNDVDSIMNPVLNTNLVERNFSGNVLPNPALAEMVEGFLAKSYLT